MLRLWITELKKLNRINVAGGSVKKITQKENLINWFKEQP